MFDSVDKLKDALCEMGHEEGVVFDNPDYADAAIGYTEEGAVVYDYDKMVEHLVKTDGMAAEEAMEFIDYNTVRAIPYAPDPKPIILYRFYE